MGGSLSLAVQDQWFNGPSQDGLCCVRRNSMSRKREETNKGQARGSNDPFSQQGTNGIQASSTNQSSPSVYKISEKPEIKDNRNSGTLPGWLRDPEPLPNWTSQQQSVLIQQLDENPLARRNQEHFKKAIHNTHRLIPEKTIEEIKLCFDHLQLKRIAYFGKEENRLTPPTGKSFKSNP